MVALVDTLKASRRPTSAAATGLKAAVMPAQLIFHANGLLDKNDNGIGEYATSLDELIASGLLQPQFNQNQSYSFDIFNPSDSKLAERHFVAVAWPQSSEQGSLMFAISNEGRVYQKAFTGSAPTRESVISDDFKSISSDWTAYQR